MTDYRRSGVIKHLMSALDLKYEPWQDILGFPSLFFKRKLKLRYDTAQSCLGMCVGMKVIVSSLRNIVIQYPTQMCGLCYYFLLILIQASSATEVTGLIGHNVTLPCMYNAQVHGVLNFCWGHGKVPNSKCANTILSSSKGAVHFRQSPRHQLLGRVKDGDLSLTILNAQRSDAGDYGCRVEILGWFNDHKVNIHLIMDEAPVKQPVTESYTLPFTETSEILTTFQPKTGEVSDMIKERVRSAPSEDILQVPLGVEDLGRIAAIFVFTLIIIVIFIIWRRVLSNKMPQNLGSITPENIYESIPMTRTRSPL
ncbi:uncharacterized protein ACNS7B_012261 isoform 1-T1 [Menidia menidia]